MDGVVALPLLELGRPLRPEQPLLAVIGPSAVGKSAVVRALVEDGTCHITPSWTTRPPRPGELATSLEHRFVSDSEFDRLLASGFFLKSVAMFDLPYRYGIPRVAAGSAGSVAVIMVRASLLNWVTTHYPRATVYQVEDDIERATPRLQARHRNSAEYGSRLTTWVRERDMGRQLSSRVFGNTGELAQVIAELRIAIAQDFDAVEVRT